MNDWLVPGDDRIPSDTHRERRGEIECVVLHYTASPFGDAAAEARRVRRWASEGRASSHFVIGRDGRVMQMVPISRAAEHTSDRRAEWPDGVVDVDSRAIGIDLMNVGPLEAADRGHRNAYGGHHLGPFASAPDGSAWEPYTSPQVDALRVLVETLIAEHPQLGDADRWVRHGDIQPGKIDPGPLFPLGDLRRWVAAAAEGICG